MSDHHDPHTGLHSEQGALAGRAPGPGEEPGREGARPGLAGVREAGPGRGPRRSRTPSGSATALRTADELQLRGTDPGAPCVLIRQGRGRGSSARRSGRPIPPTCCGWPRRPGARPRSCRRAWAGSSVDLVDPTGLAGAGGLRHRRAGRAARPGAAGAQLRPYGSRGPTRRSGRRAQPAKVQRLGHVVLQTTEYLESLDWYLQHLGLIVSDFLYYPGQRERGPVMSFIRCDRGATPTDHHTLALALGPPTATSTPPTRSPTSTRWPPAGSTCASTATSTRGASAGTSRAARSSTTGATRTGSWSSTTATATCSTTPSSRAGRRWPPPAWPSGGRRRPRTSSASSRGRRRCTSCARSLRALREDNEFDLAAVRGLLKVATLMTTSVLRTADAWYVATPDGAAKIDHQGRDDGRTAGDRDGDRRRGGQPRHRAGRLPRPRFSGHRAVPGRRPDDELRLARRRTRDSTRTRCR